MVTKNESRRKFMTALGVGGAAAAGAVLTQHAAPPVKQVAGSKDPQGGGYRLSEHVRKYYRTTQV